MSIRPNKLGGFGPPPPPASEEFEEWQDVQIAPELITREFSRARGSLDLTFPVCAYEMRGNTIFVPRKHAGWYLAPPFVEFRAVRRKDAPGLLSAFVPVERPCFCVHPSRLTRQASMSDIAGVVGTSFYTSATHWIGRSTLLAWLDGVITTHEAANYGSNILKQLGVLYPPGLTRARRRPTAPPSAKAEGFRAGGIL